MHILTNTCRPTEALQTKTGQKDGQQLLIRENDGSVTAHLWSASTGQWNLVGNKSQHAHTKSTNHVCLDRNCCRRRGHRFKQEDARRQGV